MQPQRWFGFVAYMRQGQCCWIWGLFAGETFRKKPFSLDNELNVTMKERTYTEHFLISLTKTLFSFTMVNNDSLFNLQNYNALTFFVISSFKFHLNIHNWPVVDLWILFSGIPLFSPLAMRETIQVLRSERVRQRLMHSGEHLMQ